MTIKEEKLAEHAVIIGGGFAGLLTARVLADHFEKVTILERDSLDSAFDINNPRKGVPQGPMVHTLLSKGREIVEHFLPGFEEMLLKHGAVKADYTNDAIYIRYGKAMPRMKSNKFWYLCTKQMLDVCLRLAIKNISKIETIYDSDVTNLLINQNRINGVTFLKKGERDLTNLYANLIVDASGRTTLFPDWLKEANFEKPPTIDVEIDVQYTGRIYRSPNEFPDWHTLFLTGEPLTKKDCHIFEIEGDEMGRRWIFEVSGHHGDYPGKSESDFLKYVEALDHPIINEFVKKATPLTPCFSYKLSFAKRYLYEKMTKLPEGFIAIGDALCSHNCNYAQGMLTAALSAEFLNNLLSETNKNDLNKLNNIYFSKLSKIIDERWYSFNYEQFLNPDIKGEIPRILRIMNWYSDRLNKAACKNPEILKDQLLVYNGEIPPTALFKPYVLYNALLKF